jgi:hypothetical protein
VFLFLEARQWFFRTASLPLSVAIPAQKRGIFTTIGAKTINLVFQNINFKNKFNQKVVVSHKQTITKSYTFKNKLNGIRFFRSIG